MVFLDHPGGRGDQQREGAERGGRGDQLKERAVGVFVGGRKGWATGSVLKRPTLRSIARHTAASSTINTWRAGYTFAVRERRGGGAGAVRERPGGEPLPHKGAPWWSAALRPTAQRGWQGNGRPRRRRRALSEPCQCRPLSEPCQRHPPSEPCRCRPLSEPCRCHRRHSPGDSKTRAA